MNKQTPKYSLNDLPDDDWETRFSKRVARNILRAKERAGITTQQLADRCNEFLGEERQVKPSTLNGLFAGKRRSIGIGEIFMFASALDLPTLELVISPRDEVVEIRPGHEMDSYEAIKTSLGLAPWLSLNENPLFMVRPGHAASLDTDGWLIEPLLLFWSAENRAYEAIWRAMESISRNDPTTVIEGAAAAVRAAMYDLREERNYVRQFDLRVPNVAEHLEWVVTTDPAVVTADFLRSMHAEYMQSRRDFSQLLTEKYDLEPDDASS